MVSSHSDYVPDKVGKKTVTDKCWWEKSDLSKYIFLLWHTIPMFYFLDFYLGFASSRNSPAHVLSFSVQVGIRQHDRQQLKEHKRILLHYFKVMSLLMFLTRRRKSLGVQEVRFWIQMVCVMIEGKLISSALFHIVFQLYRGKYVSKQTYYFFSWKTTSVDHNAMQPSTMLNNDTKIISLF